MQTVNKSPTFAAKVGDKKLLLGGFVFLALGAFAAYTYLPSEKSALNAAAKQEYVVELREDGFYPAELTINAGDSVKFTTTLEAPFWPASNPHPTHHYYGEFDPGHAVSREQSWSYVFKKSGSWDYHDHLNVSFRGKIFVRSADNYRNVVKNCEGAPEESQAKCWDTMISEEVKNNGVEGGFALFAKLAEAGAPLGCHWTSHRIGEEAYNVFRAGKKFPVTRATSYCGFGFYHGFMERLLRDDKNIDQAMAFCSYVNSVLGDQAQDNCFHGIGHGFTEDPPPQETWGNAQAMIKPGLAVCERLFGHTANKWEICATGVYTVIATFSSQSKYGLSLPEDDPFRFCLEEPDRYRIACFGEFAPKLDKLTDWDVSKLKGYIKNIANQEIKTLIVRVAAGAMMQRDVEKDNLENYVRGCRTLPDNLPLVCLRGVIWGLVSHSKPDKEYIKPLAVCKYSILDDSERDACYNELSLQLGRIYPSKKVREMLKNYE